MRGSPAFSLISLALAVCAATPPLKAGEKSAIVLYGDTAPTLRLSGIRADSPPQRLALPAPPTHPPRSALTEPSLEASQAFSPLRPAPVPEGQVVVAAEFGAPADAAFLAPSVGLRAPAAELPGLKFAYFTAQATPQPSADDLADPLTRLLGEQPDEYIRPIGELRADISFQPGPLPEKYDRMAAEKFARAGEIVAAFGSDRPWPPFTYAYVAPGLCHRPLYFEEPNVERYGYQLGCLQSVVSGAHFFATVPLVPYKMVLSRPHDCRYTLGQYRPGDYTPFQRTRFVWDTKAAVAQAGVVVGLVFLIP